MSEITLHSINEYDFSSFDERQLKILLKKCISTRELLNVAKKSNLLVELLKHSIIESEREKDSCGKSDSEIFDWREKKWGDRVEETFLDQKRALDSVSFWTLFTKDKGTAQEIFYQLCNQEITFQKLASVQRSKNRKHKKYSELNKILQLQLRGAGIEKPQAPIKIPSGYLLTQVIEQHPAKLDERMRNNLLIELEVSWAERQLVFRLEELNAISHQE